MKDILLALIFFGFTACGEESIQPASFVSPGVGDSLEAITLIDGQYLALPEETADEVSTRATVNTSTLEAVLQAGDAMSVCDGVLTAKYSLRSGGSVKGKFLLFDNNRFFTDNGISSDNQKFYSFYPAEAVDGWNGSEVNARIYAEQDYTENTNQTFGGYMASVNCEVRTELKTVSFTYRLLCSIVDVNLSSLGMEVNRVSIRSNDGTPLVGRFRFDCNNGSLLVVSDKDATTWYDNTQSDVVTVGNVPQGAQFVRFYVLPTFVKGGMTITIQTTDGTYYTKQTKTDIGQEPTFGLTTITSGSSDVLPVSAAYYKKIDFGKVSDATRKNNWMATVLGNVYFPFLSIMGSHDSATSSLSSGTTFVKQETYTQELSFEEQLQAGVRAFDLRPYGSTSTTWEEITLHHGTHDTGVKLKDALACFVSFLKRNPTETLFVMLHEEDENKSGTKVYKNWNRCVWQCLNEQKDFLFAVPDHGSFSLGDCRGKMVVVSRDPFTDSGDEDKIDNLGCGKVSGLTGNNFFEKTIEKLTGTNTLYTELVIRQSDYCDYVN